MIRYRQDPDNPENPIVEATPNDIAQFRDSIRVSLRHAFPKLGPDVIEDAVQLALIVACRDVPEGRVRGRYSHAPESALRAWLGEVVWRLGMNAKRRTQYRVSLIEPGAEHEGVDRRSLPDAVVDARRMLERIARETHSVGIRALLLLAEGATQREIAREIGISTDTALKEIRQARRRLVTMRDRVPWDEPRQPVPRSPRSRKRKR